MKTVLDMSFLSELIMVDTGASVTTISTDILHKLGYDTSTGKEKRIITASGVEYVRSLIINKIKIGGIEVENVEVYSHTFPESSFSLGVLGLNVLINFDVSLVFSKKEIELTNIDQEFSTANTIKLDKSSQTAISL